MVQELTKSEMAQWVWATQHPYLYTIIEISTPTILLMFIAGKLINALLSGFSSQKRRV